MWCVRAEPAGDRDRWAAVAEHDQPGVEALAAKGLRDDGNGLSIRKSQTSEVTRLFHTLALARPQTFAV